MSHLLQASVGLSGNLNTAVETVVWLIAIAIGVSTYARTKGNLGKSLMAVIGGGLLMTFVVDPSLITTSIPNAFKNVITWATSKF